MQRIKLNPVRAILTVSLLLLFSRSAFSQDDLLNQLQEDQKPVPVSATFKGARVINGQSIETRDGGVMEVVIQHRFGRVNSGVENFFGLDEAYIRLGFDFALTDHLTVGIGRSSHRKIYDTFAKYSFLEQKTNGGSPVSATAFLSASTDTQDPPSGVELEFRHTMSYVGEVLVARKFSPGFSAQLMPVWVHRNLVQTPQDVNDVFALGVAGRQKISRRSALTFEYYYQFNNTTESENYNSLSFGIDIETGGHVFQLHISNSRGMIEKEFIADTDGKFLDGDIHIGFNIIRVFQLKKKGGPPKPMDDSW